MLPSIINEHQVHPFNFYLDGKVHQGMRHEDVLYGLVCTFTRKERLKAYELANFIAEADCSAIVTVSSQYNVWIQLTPAGYTCWQRCLNQIGLVQTGKKLQPVEANALKWNSSRFFNSTLFKEAFA